MWSEVKVVEHVALRLAHSAERQPRGNDIDEHHRGRLANRTGLLQKLGKSYRTGYRYSKPLSIEHGVFMSLRGELKELHSE
jgi:hypothetical protein